jgi:hypothetical protein
MQRNLDRARSAELDWDIAFCVGGVAVDAINRHVTRTNWDIASSTKTLVDISENGVSYILGCDACVE